MTNFSFSFLFGLYIIFILKSTKNGPNGDNKEQPIRAVRSEFYVSKNSLIKPFKIVIVYMNPKVEITRPIK